MGTADRKRGVASDTTSTVDPTHRICGSINGSDAVSRLLISGGSSVTPPAPSTAPIESAPHTGHSHNQSVTVTVTVTVTATATASVTVAVTVAVTVTAIVTAGAVFCYQGKPTKLLVRQAITI
eukprot:8155519-Pyramimonas_sp.AAC.2